MFYLPVPTESDEEHPQRCKIYKAWNYCSDHSKSVEVLYKNLDGEKVLSKVHFRYDPAVSSLIKLESSMCVCVATC